MNKFPLHVHCTGENLSFIFLDQKFVFVPPSCFLVCDRWPVKRRSRPSSAHTEDRCEIISARWNAHYREWEVRRLNRDLCTTSWNKRVALADYGYRGKGPSRILNKCSDMGELSKSNISSDNICKCGIYNPLCLQLCADFHAGSSCLNKIPYKSS